MAEREVDPYNGVYTVIAAPPFTGDHVFIPTYEELAGAHESLEAAIVKDFPDASQSELADKKWEVVRTAIERRDWAFPGYENEHRRAKSYVLERVKDLFEDNKFEPNPAIYIQSKSDTRRLKFLQSLKNDIQNMEIGAPFTASFDVAEYDGETDKVNFDLLLFRFYKKLATTFNFGDFYLTDELEEIIKVYKDSYEKIDGRKASIDGFSETDRKSELYREFRMDVGRYHIESLIDLSQGYLREGENPSPKPVVLFVNNIDTLDQDTCWEFCRRFLHPVHSSLRLMTIFAGRSAAQNDWGRLGGPHVKTEMISLDKQKG